ncbi:MAG TPA: CopG family transcriptional regulator [Thermoanaerobaculia bacterium]|nr:CopG family transcriptional regulator [Thermoanaerobaculia bacterium]
MKEPIQNITLSLPKAVLRKVKILAVERQTSVSALLTGLLEEIVQREDAYASARERALARLTRPVNLGTRGQVTWTRESPHER